MIVFGGKFWMVNQFCVSRKQPLAKIEDRPTRKMAQLWLMYWPDFFRHGFIILVRKTLFFTDFIQNKMDFADFVHNKNEVY